MGFGHDTFLRPHLGTSIMKGGMSRSRILAIVIVATMLSVPFVGFAIQSDEVDAASPSYNPYYEALDADGKKLYDAFVENAESENLNEFKVTLTNDFNSTVSQQAFYAFKWSCPEYFWVSNVHCLYLHNEVDITFDLVKTVEDASDKAAKIDELQSRVDAEVAKYTTTGVFDYDLVKGFHDRMINNTRYDHDAVGEPSDEESAYDITGVFLDSMAVCQGYSMAMKYLCDIAGIPCINISGDAYNGQSPTPQKHMWNYIMMGDGEWYCLDATWDDPTTSDGSDVLRYDYFLVGANTNIDGMKFIESHVPVYDGVVSSFGSRIPALDAESPNTLSSSDYRIRPGSEGQIVYDLGDSGTEPFVLNMERIDPDDPDNVISDLCSDCSFTFTTNGVRFTLTYDAMKDILSEMKATLTDEFVFGCAIETVTLKDIFSREYTRGAYVPYIINDGEPILDLDEVGNGIDVRISIPYELGDNDIEALVSAWSVDKDGELDDVDCVYEGGYVTFVTDDMDETYVVTGNPLGDFSLIVVGAIAIGVALVILIVLALIIRAIVKR